MNKMNNQIKIPNKMANLKIFHKNKNKKNKMNSWKLQNNYKKICKVLRIYKIQHYNN